MHIRDCSVKTLHLIVWTPSFLNLGNSQFPAYKHLSYPSLLTHSPYKPTPNQRNIPAWPTVSTCPSSLFCKFPCFFTSHTFPVEIFFQLVFITYWTVFLVWIVIFALFLHNWKLHNVLVQGLTWRTALFQTCFPFHCSLCKWCKISKWCPWKVLGAVFLPWGCYAFTSFGRW